MTLVFYTLYYYIPIRMLNLLNVKPENARLVMNNGTL